MEVYMRIANYKNTENTGNKHGISAKKIYETKNALIMHLTLQPDEKLKPHITSEDVAFYILEGSPDILIGNTIKSVKQDDLVESPKDIVHCIYNNSESQVRVLVMKLPRPTQPTIFVDEV